jgi:hypothetical protein
MNAEQVRPEQVRRLARAEGGVQRGKARDFRPPWPRVFDEMEDAEARTVGALNAVRVRTLYEGIRALDRRGRRPALLPWVLRRRRNVAGD